jgi:hypothetical protein
MKVIDIALKDLWHSFRNAMFIVFGLVLPLATGALFYFAFGGMISDDSGFELAPIHVQVVNLDEGGMGTRQSPSLCHPASRRPSLR